MGKETKEVVRFIYQTEFSSARFAYLHIHECLPPGDEAPDTITEDELDEINGF